jgi:L-iditol 2-dehydrogenase
MNGHPSTMKAARVHGPRDMRLETVPHPGPPGPSQVLLRVLETGICGSDLHSYEDARIGTTKIETCLVLGHEFSAVVEEAGPDSLDGGFKPIGPGARVAVDPAQPCGRCESCIKGHPNLCSALRFCGNYPYDGCLREWMHVPSGTCFPLPEGIDDVEGAMLEPLGVAIHAVDLARIRVTDSVAILGAGPIGLLILQVARLAGADPVFVSDKFPWRLAAAERLGGVPVSCGGGGDLDDPVGYVQRETRGRGVDIAIEAAWAERSIEEACEMARLGGRVVLVGIPSDDRLTLKHSTARRKGLTILMARRMKHTYPRAIRLVENGRVDVAGLVSHRFPLAEAQEAFALNAAYRDGVMKVVIDGPSASRATTAG